MVSQKTLTRQKSPDLAVSKGLVREVLQVARQPGIGAGKEFFSALAHNPSLFRWCVSALPEVVDKLKTAREQFDAAVGRGVTPKEDALIYKDPGLPVLLLDCLFPGLITCDVDLSSLPGMRDGHEGEMRVVRVTEPSKEALSVQPRFGESFLSLRETLMFLAVRKAALKKSGWMHGLGASSACVHSHERWFHLTGEKDGTIRIHARWALRTLGRGSEAKNAIRIFGR